MNFPNDNQLAPAVSSVRPRRLLKADCYHCGQPMSYNEDDGGRRIKCPACDNPFRLPGGERALALYRGDGRALAPSTGYLPAEVAVELAEEEIFERREARHQRNDLHRFKVRKLVREEAETQSNTDGKLGAAINGVCVAMILLALPFAKSLEGYVIFICAISAPAGMWGMGLSAWSAFQPERESGPGVVGIGLGLLLFLLIPLGFKLAT